jgi:hypothetical protein
MTRVAAGTTCAGARRWAEVLIALGKNVKTELMFADDRTQIVYR